MPLRNSSHSNRIRPSLAVTWQPAPSCCATQSVHWLSRVTPSEEGKTQKGHMWLWVDAAFPCWQTADSGPREWRKAAAHLPLDVRELGEHQRPVEGQLGQVVVVDAWSQDLVWKNDFSLRFGMVGIAFTRCILNFFFFNTEVKEEEKKNGALMFTISCLWCLSARSPAPLLPLLGHWLL